MLHDDKSKVWSKLWNIRTLPKHVNLAWKILLKGLSVKKNLIKRGMLIDPLCPWCHEKEEDIDHIKTCPWAQHVWFLSHLGVHFDNMSPLFTDWFENIIISLPSEVSKRILSVVNSMKITPINTSCVEQLIIKQPISRGTIINTSRSRKQWEKEREHKRIYLPSSVQIDLVSEREQLSVPL